MTRTLVAAGLALTLAPWTVHAQGLGLPLGETAAPFETGQVRATGAITLGDDVDLYGARVAYATSPNLQIFGDAGIVDIDAFDSGLGLQGGLIYRIEMDAPIDLGLRGTGYTAFLDDLDHLFGFSAGVLVSVPVADAPLSLYGYVGLAHTRLKASFRHPVFGRVRFRDNNTEPAITLGALFAVNDQFSLFGEFSHVDDPFVSIGARFNF